MARGVGNFLERHQGAALKVLGPSFTENEAPMGKPRVFILYSTSLFARGLEHLLRQENGLEVVGVAAKGKQALTQIRSLKPDVIIVEAGGGRPGPWPILSQLLQERGEGRVISLGLGENSAVLYTGCRWAATEVKDLIKMVLADQPSG